jgi:uncharacterized protein (TIGR02646 family)
MRRISKTHPPKSLRDWIEANRDLPNCDFEHSLPSGVKAELRKHLIKEQYYLCAYAGVAIANGTCHIEHIKPQNRCDAGEDVAYRNLVACYPADGGDESQGFGAPMKKGWWDESLFVSPLSEDCERRFSYAWSGTMQATQERDTAARVTIETLGLNCQNIRALRRHAVAGFFGFGHGKQEISLKEATILLAAIDKPNSEGKLRAFCFVLKRLLERFIAEKSRKSRETR